MIFPQVQHLYMYKSFSQHTLNIFQTEHLWAPYPVDFNDPFDCQLDPAQTFTLDGLIGITEHQHTSNRNNWPNERRHLIERLEYNPSELQSLAKKTSDYFQQIVMGMGIVCYTANPDSILMWAYYNNHKGICIEFPRTDQNELGQSCMPVDYVQAYPAINLNDLVNGDYQTLLRAIIYSKAKCWSHENEWRMQYNEGRNSYKWPEKPSKVIFGINASGKDRTDIEAECQRLGIPTAQANRVPLEFRIEIT